VAAISDLFAATDQSLLKQVLTNELLASSPSTSAVQTGLYHVQVTIWSAPQYLVIDVQLLADSGRRLLRSDIEHASFHGHRTVSATEPFLLLELKSGTICHRNCDTWKSALDNSETC